MKKQITDYLVFLIVRTLVCILQSFSVSMCESMSRIIAVLMSDILNVRGKITRSNLQNAYPDWSEEQLVLVQRRMWEHLILLVCEVAHAPRKIHDTNWRKFISVRNKKTMVEYLLDPRPVVLVSGHFGNFELAGYTAGVLGFPTYAIARKLDNPYLNRLVNDFRASKGQFILDKHGSAKLVKDVFDSGSALSLLADQYAGDRGCWVEFMGQPASNHKAIAVFTLTGDAPMVVCYARRIGRMLELEVGTQGIADPAVMDEGLRGVKELTQWYNHRLEELINRDPQQYWWLHRRWRGAPPRRKKREKQAA